MSFLSHSSLFPSGNGRELKSIQQSPQQKDSRTSIPTPVHLAAPFHFSADSRGFPGRVPDLASALYGLPYANSPVGFGSFPQSIDPTVIQATLSRLGGHTGLPDQWGPHVGQTPFGAYDPAVASLMCQSGYGALGMGDNGRRKNATRETTATLKAWLNEHRKNPYPTKGEKIMLAIVSKMTLTQVSTWFANARRRLKKENRMTWSPRNRHDRLSEDEETDDAATENNASPIIIDGGKSSGNPVVPSLDHPELTRPVSSNEQSHLPESEHFSTPSKLADPLSYNHLHAQLFLRQFANLPVHLRPADAYRHYQQHFQDCQRVAKTEEPQQAKRLQTGDETRRSDPFSPYPHIASTAVKQDDCRRRHSLNSTASVSSCGHSPSPPTNNTPHCFVTQSGEDGRGFAESQGEQTGEDVADAPVASTSDGGRKGDSLLRQKGREHDKKMSKIWSPVNLPERPPHRPDLSTSSRSDTSHSSRESPFPDPKFRGRFASSGETGPGRWPGAGPAPLHQRRCDPEVALHQRRSHSTNGYDEREKDRTASSKAMNEWINEYSEYHRQLTYQRLTAKTQHALAATLASLAVNRSASDGIGHHQQQNSRRDDRFPFSSEKFRTDALSSEMFRTDAGQPSEEKTLDGDEDATTSDSEADMPINLSKHKQSYSKSENSDRFAIDDRNVDRMASSVAAT